MTFRDLVVAINKKPKGVKETMNNYTENARIKNDLVQRRAGIDREIRVLNDTLTEQEQEINKINRSLPLYKGKLKDADAEAIKELYQKTVDTMESELERLTKAHEEAAVKIVELQTRSQEFFNEIKKIVV